MMVKSLTLQSNEQTCKEFLVAIVKFVWLSGGLLFQTKRFINSKPYVQRKVCFLKVVF